MAIAHGVAKHQATLITCVVIDQQAAPHRAAFFGNKMKKIKVTVLCTNSEGSPEFHWVSLDVTQTQYDNGDHYEIAKAAAESEGYEGPMIAFDENDAAARQVGDLLTWL
jgi:hypothetical protein